jgi:hypothetical protein
MSSTQPLSSEQSIKDALSSPRIGTYEAATTGTPQLQSALALYAWNAQVSASMLAPLHFCEVVIRNAVADAIAAAHGPQWPWDAGFLRSLPDTSAGYKPRKDLLSARAGKTTTGKVIPELKFMFWQTIFTSRFDARLWRIHLRTVLPHADTSKTVDQVRALIYAELEQLRKLRNRIAHHEPIFKRNLADDLQKVHDLIAFRCPITAAWMTQNHQVQALIATKPP